MKKKLLLAWTITCVISGTTLGALLCWAKDNPKSELHQKFTEFGFHLE